MQHIAQHPEARHPRAERQAVRQLRRAVYQCGDEPNDDEIRNKRAGDAQQRRKDAQSVLAVPPFCQLCQPRGGRAIWLNFFHGELLSTALRSKMLFHDPLADHCADKGRHDHTGHQRHRHPGL